MFFKWNSKNNTFLKNEMTNARKRCGRGPTAHLIRGRLPAARPYRGRPPTANSVGSRCVRSRPATLWVNSRWSATICVAAARLSPNDTLPRVLPRHFLRGREIIFAIFIRERLLLPFSFLKHAKLKREKTLNLGLSPKFWWSCKPVTICLSSCYATKLPRVSMGVGTRLIYPLVCVICPIRI